MLLAMFLTGVFVGYAVGFSYNWIFKRWKGNGGNLYKVKLAIGRWGKWSAIFIFPLPFTVYKDATAPIPALIIVNTTFKFAIWIWIGLIGSLIVGGILWLYYRIKT